MNFFNNLKIGKKLGLGFGLVLVILLAVSLFTYTGLNHLVALSDAADRRGKDAVRIQEACSMPDKVYAVFADAFINTNLDENSRTFQAVEKEFQEDMKAVENAVDTPEEKALAAKCRLAVEEYLGSYPKWVELIKAGKTDDVKKLDARLDVLRSAFTTEMGKISESLNAEAEESNGEFNSVIRGLESMLLWMAIVGSCLAIGLGIVVSNAITHPIRRTAEMLKDISEGEGDLTKRLEVASHDEIGDMATYFNRFLDKLQSLIKQVSGNADTVASSATELSAASTQIASSSEEMSIQTVTVATATKQATMGVNSISSAAEQMSASASSVAAAIEEMNASLNEVAKNCHKELQIAGEAAKHARGGRETMGHLDKAAQAIGNVVKVINTISDQTNLLALNATIEAASAGEAGKGFSVVANEVKELSKQTAKATQEIQAQIEEMQGHTTSAVRAIELLANVIEEVNTISQSIASAVEEQSVTVSEISKNVANVSGGAQDVARNVTESARGLSDVSANVSGFSTSVANTSQGTAQVKMSAEELARLSNQLKQILGQFKI